MMEERQQQGFAYTEESVCTGCVDDYALEAAITAAVVPSVECSFCRSQPSAPLGVLFSLFVAGIKHEYQPAIESTPIDDGFVWPTTDTYALVYEFGEGVLLGDGLMEAVQCAVDDDGWIERDYVWRRRDEVLVEAWDLFSEAVKFKTRYVLWLQEDKDEDAAFYCELPVGKILLEVGKLVDRLGLVKPMPPGTKWWRAQVHDKKIPRTASRLGTAPVHFARQANRMSPAGIPMF